MDLAESRAHFVAEMIAGDRGLYRRLSKPEGMRTAFTRGAMSALGHIEAEFYLIPKCKSEDGYIVPREAPEGSLNILMSDIWKEVSN